MHRSPRRPKLGFGVFLMALATSTGALAQNNDRLFLPVDSEAADEFKRLEELGARAIRLGELEDTLPRYRHVGPMSLDLLAREAYAQDKPLGLHPREFGLLWRLADTPGQTVSKEDLVRDVWRMGFVPETNSLAVHVSRLRGKLGVAKLEGLLETVPAGGYRLKVSGEDESGSALREVRERFVHFPKEKSPQEAPADPD